MEFIEVAVAELVVDTKRIESNTLLEETHYESAGPHWRNDSFRFCGL